VTYFFIGTSKKKESCNRQWYVLYIIETIVQHIEIIRLAIKEKISLKKYNDKEKYFGILSSCSHFELCGRMLIIALNKCQAILFVLDCVYNTSNYHRHFKETNQLPLSQN